MRFNPLFRPAAEARLIRNYGEAPRAPTGAELHPEMGSAFHKEAQEMIKNAQGMGKQVEATRSEVNNNVHWGPFQRAEQEYISRFTSKFVNARAQTVNLQQARASGSLVPLMEMDHFGPDILRANMVLNLLLNATPQNEAEAKAQVALKARVRSFKEEFCKVMNEQFAKQDINWRLGPGLDNTTNFDGQRGDRYTDIRPHQEALNKNLTEYGQAYQKFVTSRPMVRGQQGFRMPSMTEILQFKINWCAQKNQALAKMQAEGRTNDPAYVPGGFYEGNAWNPYIGYDPQKTIERDRAQTVTMTQDSATVTPAANAAGEPLNQTVTLTARNAAGEVVLKSGTDRDRATSLETQRARREVMEAAVNQLPFEMRGRRVRDIVTVLDNALETPGNTEFRARAQQLITNLNTVNSGTTREFLEGMSKTLRERNLGTMNVVIAQPEGTINTTGRMPNPTMTINVNQGITVTTIATVELISETTNQ